jgi:hypothetical protein
MIFYQTHKKEKYMIKQVININIFFKVQLVKNNSMKILSNQPMNILEICIKKLQNKILNHFKKYIDLDKNNNKIYYNIMNNIKEI